MEDKEEKTPQSEKPQSIAEIMGKDEDEGEDAALLASLVGPDGKLIVDTSLPKGFELDIMAATMVDHLVSFKQNQKAWLSAKQLGDNPKREASWKQWRWNQLTIALIQKEFPAAKKLADQIMEVRANMAQQQREERLKQES